MKTTTERQYYRPEELCDLLPLGRTVIYRELKAGTIPSIRMGNRYIIPRASFHAWMASCGNTRPAA